nr:polysaccharide biosynthesis protein [Burkholderiales bacterium]
LYEELLIGNNPDKTDHSRIMKAHETYFKYDDLQQYINLIKKAVDDYDINSLTNLIKEMVPDYKPLKTFNII